MYQPLAEQLSDVEREFLAKVAPLGLDFLTTRQRYAERFGRQSYYGWRDVITLNQTRALTQAPLSFVMYAEPESMDLAPEYLWADYLEHDDARKNHSDMLVQLSNALGAGSNEDVSNCLQQRWRFGVFRVELHTFPPELQRPSKNLLHELNPRLAIGASVSIHSELAFPYPDGTLEPFADAVRLGSATVLDVASAPKGNGLGGSRRFLRRVPRGLQDAVPSERLLAWRDEAASRLVFATAYRALVLERAEVEHLTLRRMEPDRGPAAVRLELALTGNAPAPERSICVLEADGAWEPSPLRGVATRLAAHFRLALVERPDATC
jgi:hypothetical protein